MVGTVAGVGVAAYADGDSQPTTSGDTSTTQTQTTETPATDGASGNKTGESGESEADTKSDSTGADADTAQSGDAVAKQAAPAPASVDAVAARKALPSILGNVPSTNGSIKVNLFDYNTNGRDGNINYASGSNRIMRPFTFGPTDSVAGRSLNAWTGNNGGLYQGIVSSDLTGDGYPQLASGSTSLGYLFGGEYNVNGLAESHADVDGLFQEKNGYYTYDSAKNYAQYDSTDNKFDLYDGGRFYNGGLPNDAGAFMPFNSLSTNTHNYNGTDGYGLNKDNNYYFGMTVSTTFMMPKDGKVNNDDMVFEFEGDDDVWVYLDGKLALDLGGIHNNYGGSINFATGKITYSNGALGTHASNSRPRNLSEVLGGDWNTAYRNHTLKMFYLERGAGSSNCKVRFNLPTIDSSQIQIGKETEGDVSADTEFKFNANVNYDGEGDDYELYTGDYDVYDTVISTKVGETQTAIDGVITLKAGQYAVLKGSDEKKIAESSKYYVKELDVAQDKYAVSANGGQVKVTQEEDSATTTEVAVSDVPRTTVTNTVVTAPEHRKYIKANNDGTYDLSLNVTGTQSSSSQTTVSPADIVVVFDTSGSMSNGMGSQTRLQVAKAAVNSMAEQLLTAENKAAGKDKNIQMALVSFSTTAGTVSNFTDTAAGITSTVNGLRADGGTNWEAALKRANTLLASSNRKDVKKYIVFMSDGDPTYRDSANGYTKDCKDQRIDGNRVYLCGTGSSDPSNRNFNAAVAEANKRGDATLFSVGVSSDPDKMSDFAERTAGTYFSAADEEGLNKAFNAIIGQIEKHSSYKNVSITDTLSDYAEFASANFGSNDVTVTASKGGNSVDLNKSDYTVTVSGKTVKVTFVDGYELQDGVTYTVTFKVRPTQKAYDDYATNKQTDGNSTGYGTVTGDSGTDAPNNDTSSGKPGFHSNADHGAKLTYTAVNQVGDHKTETPGSVEYDHPVLQVKTGKIQVTKNWDPTDSEPKDGSNVTVNIYKGDHADDSQKVDTLTLTKDGGWTGSLGNLAPDAYFVEETNVDGYTASYSQSQTVTITAGELWEAEPNMTKFDNVKTYDVAITNTLNRVDLDVNANVKVRKTVQGAAASEDFTFNLTCATGNAACQDGVTWPKDSNGSLIATASKADLQATGTPADAKFPDGSTLQLKAPTGTTPAVYKFTVSEDQSGKSAGWKYDTDAVTVRVTVSKKTDGSGYETKVEYVYADDDSDKTDKPTSADFTNTYVAVSSLPLTGGKSARDWLVYGGGLGLMALLAAASYTVWRKRQLV
ncbi:VWA domain-containing protein [Bifidobacterium longum]|uniref:DUF7604 domain-containing protein n=1 Tax=Bifidobacterium longum TaxID=216816 RepID=UPI00398D0A09